MGEDIVQLPCDEEAFFFLCLVEALAGQYFSLAITVEIAGSNEICAS